MKNRIVKVTASLLQHPKTLQTAVCLCIMLLCMVNTAHAQLSDPGGDVDNAPIDGGLSLLVAAGVGYGAKKLKRKKAEV